MRVLLELGYEDYNLERLYCSRSDPNFLGRARHTSQYGKCRTGDTLAEERYNQMNTARLFTEIVSALQYRVYVYVFRDHIFYAIRPSKSALLLRHRARTSARNLKHRYPQFHGVFTEMLQQCEHFPTDRFSSSSKTVSCTSGVT